MNAAVLAKNTHHNPPTCKILRTTTIGLS